jgi:predicted nucleic acid-binding protein
MALAKLDLLNLLPKLYDQVLVPAAVYDEVVLRGMEAGYDDAGRVRDAAAGGDLQVVNVDEETIAESLRALAIGLGERDAIHLALQQPVDWILVDDALARNVAAALAVRVKGTLGVIVDAYRSGVISSRGRDQAFEAILSRDDIWIDESLVRRVWAELSDDQEQTGAAREP